MSTVLATDRGPLPEFVQLSSGLTGYECNELWGTGMAESYYKHLKKEAGAKITKQLLSYSEDVIQLLNNKELSSYARAVIRLWYVGQWAVVTEKKPLPAIVYSLEPNAYTQSLAWRAMGGHAQGARQQGYGSWSRPPIGAEEDES